MISVWGCVLFEKTSDAVKVGSWFPICIAAACVAFETLPTETQQSVSFLFFPIVTHTATIAPYQTWSDDEDVVHCDVLLVATSYIQHSRR